MSRDEWEHTESKFDCVCDTLLLIQKTQQKAKSMSYCGYNHRYVPVVLQTPYGNPFVTFGSVGKKDCFLTVFFKVIRVDCENNCAQLELLRPNRSIVDEETGEVEWEKICQVEYVTKTSECITVKLGCYNAVKCLPYTFGK
ncbi:CotY/CotZ family spore coat protein [Allobacillus sp. GCM10007491]|uniref:Spore coat protein Z n=1 Tax=Allobacillus saliphilus TaxID=2912308 RepID=A0A941CU74_9BACI|nr:hypothetical protein [Allobacillus saliphilus]